MIRVLNFILFLFFIQACGSESRTDKSSASKTASTGLKKGNETKKSLEEKIQQKRLGCKLWFDQTKNKCRCEIKNGYGSKTLDLKTAEFAECQAERCNASFHIEKAKCESNRKSCELSKEQIGIQQWNEEKMAWEDCKKYYCGSGRFYDGQNCKSCPKGHFCKDSIKTACSVGNYLNREGGYKCIKCPKDQFQAKEGQEKCEDCPMDQVPNLKQSLCTKKPSCPAGQYADGLNCRDCPAGYFCKNSQKSQCDENSFQSQKGKDSCQKCTLGFKSTSTRTRCYQLCTKDGEHYDGKQCAKCPKGSYCVRGIPKACKAGSYQSAEGQKSCRQCSGNTYQPSSGKSSCKSCPSNSKTNTTHTACKKIPSCGLGKYYNGYLCMPCKKGHYCKNNGVYPCEPGSYSGSTGRSSCQKCEDHHATARRESYFCEPCRSNYTHNSTRTRCVRPTCKYGTYISGRNCKPCSSGKSNASRTKCL